MARRFVVLLMMSLLLSVSAIMAQEEDRVGYNYWGPPGVHEIYCEGMFFNGGNAVSIKFNKTFAETVTNVEEGHRIQQSLTVRRNNNLVYETGYNYTYPMDFQWSGPVTGTILEYGFTFGDVYLIERVVYDVDNNPISFSSTKFECPTNKSAGTATFILLFYGDSAPALSDAKTVVQPQNTEAGLEFTLWDATQTGTTFRITSEQINAIPAFPESNTLVTQSEDGYYRFYRLTTGELQLNTGPDFEGKEFVTVFNAGGQAIKTYTIDPQ